MSKRLEPDPDCFECGGTGWVRVNAPVYPDDGSPSADIDEKPCICTAPDPDPNGGDGEDD